MNKQGENETRQEYLQRARRYARQRFDELRQASYMHESFDVETALSDTETAFTDLQTFGVEGDCEENGEGCITIQYLNTGETYDPTICYYEGRFIVASWGDIVESAIAEW